MDTNRDIILKVGPLTSFRSLLYYLSPKLTELREAYVVGKTPNVFWDITSLGQRNINISVLTAFVGIAKRVRDFVGKPIPVLAIWNPNVLAFLADVDFFEIDKKFQLFEWKEGFIGGFQRGNLNPNSKILYFADIPKIEFKSMDDLNSYKAELKQRIAPNLFLRTSEIFDGINTKLKLTVSNTTLELIANSLIHGQSIAFVGVQRTKPRISVSVCDTGIGFPRSLKKYLFQKEFKMSHAQGIVIGSLIQKKEHGLRLAISEVLNYNNVFEEYVDQYIDEKNDGWVIISSYDTEIRWQKNNWQKAKVEFDKEDLRIANISEYKILGKPLEDFPSSENTLSGYWSKYDNFLIGTRITFEIPTNRK